MTKTTNMMPLMIDLSDKKVVIFGSGNVAKRKVTLFLQYTDVTVINHSIDDSFADLSNNSEHELNVIPVDLNCLLDIDFQEFVKNAFLVITATADFDLNVKIATIAKSCGALINKVDDAAEVIIPSIVKQGDMTVSIATNGASPALSKYTRLKIENLITEDYAKMAQLQKEMRQYYKIHIASEDERKTKLWSILQSQEIWNALSESYDRAYKLAQNI